MYLLNDIEIKPGEILKIPTGVKVVLEKDEVLLLVIKSSRGFKWNIRLCNQIGVIDSDYYNNVDNEGHIWIKIQNEGEKTVKIEKGRAMAQGIFIKYLVTSNDEPLDINRKGNY